MKKSTIISLTSAEIEVVAHAFGSNLAPPLPPLCAGGLDLDFDFPFPLPPPFGAGLELASLPPLRLKDGTLSLPMAHLLLAQQRTRHGVQRYLYE